MKYFIKTFANLDTFSKFIEEAPVNRDVFRGTLESETGSRRFTGTESFDEAKTLLRDGDEKNAKRVINVTAPGKISAKDIRPRRERSYYGGAVNIGAVVTGRPKTMYRNVMQKTDTKVLTFVYNTSVSCTVTASDIATTAANLMSAICGIEKRGYRVNLYAGKISTDGKECFAALVKVKDSKTYMDRKKMAYPLINPSMNRRHMFAALERSDVTRGSWSWGYGYCASKEDATEAVKRAGIDARAVVSYWDLCSMDAAGIINYLLK